MSAPSQISPTFLPLPPPPTPVSPLPPHLAQDDLVTHPLQLGAQGGQREVGPGDVLEVEEVSEGVGECPGRS
jgi:hypothetical protein